MGVGVSGHWTGSYTWDVFGTTGSDGRVRLASYSVKNGGTFTFTVTDVVKTGRTYNPALNVETTDTITAP